MTRGGGPQARASALVLVREARGLTQTQVAEGMTGHLFASDGQRVSQGYVSRAEKGRLAVSGARLSLYAKALGCVPELLCVEAKAGDVGVGLIHHRKKAAMSAPALRRVCAQLALARTHLDALFDAVGTKASGAGFTRPQFDATICPADAAAAVRELWGMPPGPAGDLIGLFEGAGGLVLARDLGCNLLDVVSQWPSGAGPLLLADPCAPGEQLRYSIAHELGHLVLHRVPGDGSIQEKQADQFAAAFLMPSEDIQAELGNGLDLARLSALKQRWRVSMRMLLRRAHSLGAISEWRYRAITMDMSALGFQLAEPGSLKIEGPRAVRSAIKHALDHGMDTEELARRTRLQPAELLRDFGPALRVV